MAGDPAAVLARYIAALAARDLAALDDLIAADAVFHFTDGTHRGRPAIVAATGAVFSRIPDDEYRISDESLAIHGDEAVVSYAFHWTGTIDGSPASGSGRGRTVLRRTDRWRIASEDLRG
ncbi:DUF4440 domain-containing protein [Microbacterium gorillae]|uniref:DUF4440 domain-containing protein n=1 Tax=Microbacterium gorillae TaxID=1231063 RepID=UPI00058C7E13|nr:DUF4440 domain-containing protein [Microbacterium gorillae]